MISLISLFMEGSGDLEKLKILRILRVLRPLRLIQRNEGLRLAIDSLLKSIPSMVNLFVVCIILFVLFGIFGVNQFKGKFYSCKFEYQGFSEAEITEKRRLIDTREDCFDVGGDWINEDFNFDNIANAMVTLFAVASTEGWPDLMWTGVDSYQIGHQPRENENLHWSLFYILFILFGSFFIMNLFAGIVVDTFNQEKEKALGTSSLTGVQKEYLMLRQKILLMKPIIQIKPLKRYSYLRNKVIQLISHPKFEVFILFCIILNTITYMLVWSRQPQDLVDALSIINQVEKIGLENSAPVILTTQFLVRHDPTLSSI